MAGVLDACVGGALSELSALLKEKACMILQVEDDLEELLERRASLKIFLEDAENKSEDGSIRNWLGGVRGVMYDAEDVIESCRIKDPKLLERTHSVRSCFPLMSCFSATKFRYEIAPQIKKLNKKLKEIDERRPSEIQSSTRLAGNNTMSTHSFDKRQTSPVMPESDYVGEDVEKASQRIVTSLIEEPESRTKCRVWGIVGMGGIGKTTLATKVFNHPTIVSHFTNWRIWVCISQTFSETDILKQIIRGATKKDCGEASSKAELDQLLISSLSSKFLIVLDDVWSTDIWENLLRKSLEKCKAPSGRVVVTTRDKGIARAMQATLIHNVEKMNPDAGWALLCKKVFGDDGKEEEILDVKDIGLQIVKKCDGLPLAIKVIAGVLRYNGTSRKEWEKLLRNQAWSMDRFPEELRELRGALYLSYVDLPSKLKQCFLYCSLFPEDSDILIKHVVHWWVAEGFIQEDALRFIQEDEDGDLMEDTAENYYKQLITRNLLQCIEPGVCRMHDLLRSLAKFLIEEENICIDSDAAEKRVLNTNRSVRRLSFTNRSEMTTPLFDGIKESTRGLRSLLWLNKYKPHPFQALPSDLQALIEGDNLVKILQRLRVLYLPRSGIKRLPDSVGKLVHLRYLNLEWTSIHKIPESIMNLVNLQVLCLSNCKCLYSLPNGITQLSNLRYLDVRDTSLVCLPKGINQLKQLNRLEGFLVGDVDSSNRACQIEELQPLSNLRMLSIDKLERVQETTGTSLLTNKRLLKKLTLSFSEPGEYGCEYGENGFGYDEAEVKIMEDVMEKLCPPSNLEELYIMWYPGCKFPRWMRNGFSRLERVILNGCESCKELPPLGQLPQLKSLEIENAGSIVSVGPEFFFGDTTGTGEGAFPKLEYLRFDGMSEWEELVLEYNTRKLLPRLKQLEVDFCPKLRSLPSGLQHATSLQRLSIFEGRCIEEVKNLPSLTEELQVDRCPCLREIQHLPSLQTLDIGYCPKLSRVSDVDSLQKLRLRLEWETERLPHWLLELALERQQRKTKPDCELQLYCNSRCREGGEYWTIINQFPRVHITTEDFKESTIVNDIQVSDAV